MFSSYTQGQDVKTPPVPHDGSRTKTSDFLSDPAALCTRFTVMNEEAFERVHYTIQDTPGFGDDTDICRSIDLILNYIDESNKVRREGGREGGREGVITRFRTRPGLGDDDRDILSVGRLMRAIRFGGGGLPPSLPPFLPPSYDF